MLVRAVVLHVRVIVGAVNVVSGLFGNNKAWLASLLSISRDDSKWK